MKLNSIQMLRAVAALLVVYTHSISQMGIFAIGWQQRTPMRISLGTFGVDLFFVISGFIIYLSASRLEGPNASLSFLWHRFRRINPAYYAAVIFTVITWVPSLIRHQRPPITSRMILSWSVLLPFPGAPPRALSQVWSLWFEWFFYLAFFLLILTRTRKKATFLFILLGGMTLLGWLLRDNPSGWWSFYTDPLLLEFLSGVAIAVAFERWTPRRSIALCLLLPGIILGLFFILSGYGDYQATPAPSAPLKYFHALCWGSAATLVVSGCVFLEKNRPPAFFRHRLILLPGDASYSIYLFHMVVFGGIAALYLRIGFFLNADIAIPLHAAIAVAGSLVFYSWVEKPLLQWLRRYDTRRSTPPRLAKP